MIGQSYRERCVLTIDTVRRVARRVGRTRDVPESGENDIAHRTSVLGVRAARIIASGR